MGIVHSKNDEPEDAIKWLRRALAVDPRSLDVLNAIGNARRSQDQGQEAIDYYRRALEVDPNFLEKISNLSLF